MNKPIKPKIMLVPWISFESFILYYSNGLTVLGPSFGLPVEQRPKVAQGSFRHLPLTGEIVSATA